MSLYLKWLVSGNHSLQGEMMSEGALTSFTLCLSRHCTSHTVLTSQIRSRTEYHVIINTKWLLFLLLLFLINNSIWRQNLISLAGFNTIYWWFCSGLLLGHPVIQYTANEHTLKFFITRSADCRRRQRRWLWSDCNRQRWQTVTFQYFRILKITMKPCCSNSLISRLQKADSAFVQKLTFRIDVFKSHSG